MSYTLFEAAIFGTTYSASATIGYRLYNADNSANGARVTTGITERGTGTGVYAATVSFPDSFTGELRWDTGGSSPVYASRFVNPKSVENDDVKISTRLAASNSGVGAFAVTITVKDGSNNLLQNARVRLTEGVNTFTALTDINGVASFNVNAATYALVITKTGYFYAGSSIAVIAAANFAAAMTQIVIPAPSDPDQATGFIVTRDAQGVAVGNVGIFFQLMSTPGADSYRTAEFEVKSDENGLLEVALLKGATYRAKRAFQFKVPETAPSWVQFVVPGNVGSFALPQILGAP